MNAKICISTSVITIHDPIFQATHFFISINIHLLIILLPNYSKCFSSTHPPQFWKLMLSGEMTNGGLCLDGDGNNPRNIVMYECHGLKGNQQWFITEVYKQFKVVTLYITCIVVILRLSNA